MFFLSVLCGNSKKKLSAATKMFRRFSISHQTLLRTSTSSSSAFGFISRDFASTSLRFCSSNQQQQQQDEIETPDLVAVSTAAAISRTLRNYRDATSKNTNNNNNNSWVDLEQLLSSKYLSRMDIEQHDTSNTNTNNSNSNSWSSSSSATSPSRPHTSITKTAAPVLRPLHTAEEILSGSGVFRAAGVELRPQLLVRLNPPATAATVFVDSEGIMPEDLVGVFTGTCAHTKKKFGGGQFLKILPDYSSITVVRQANAPNAGRMTRNFGKRLCELTDMNYGRFSVHEDVVVAAAAATASENNNNNNNNAVTIRNYVMIEKLATQLFENHPVVLNDVVYVCSDRNFSLYCDHVAKAVEFLDADVFVYSPNFMKQVYSKVVLPCVSATL